MKNVNELKAMTVTDLKSQLADLEKEHFKLRMLRATDQLKEVHKFGLIKKQIARVKTFLNNK